MPNLVATIRQNVLAAHPEARIVERGRNFIRHQIADSAEGLGRFVLDASVGWLHYNSGTNWGEVNTDWTDSSESGFVDGNITSGFLVHSDANGRRKLYPRRNVSGEYVEFAALQGWNGSAFVNVPWSSRIRNGNTISFDRANASLLLIHNGSQVKIEIVLKDASAAVRLRWPVSLTGLTRDGWLLRSTSDGSAVVQIKQPAITADGTGPLSTPRAVSASVTGGAVEFTADLSGLAYPITIDPSLDVSVGASNDDAMERDDLGSFFAAFGDLYVTAASADYNRFDTGMRFAVSGPPSGATITAAYFSGYNHDTGNDDVAADIYCEAVDNAADYAATAHVQSRARTTASSSWAVDSLGTGWANSPDISGAVQEVINRAGWSSGNYLNVLVIGKNQASLKNYYFYSYDNGATVPALHIDYTSGAGGPASIRAAFSRFPKSVMRKANR